jgi:hypothetical protein
MDFLPQLAGIGLASQGVQFVTVILGDGGSGTQAIEGGLGSVIATYDVRWTSFEWGDDLVGQVHDWLEEVVVEPHFVVERVEDLGLFDGIEPTIADQAPD